MPLADESVQCVVTSPPYWGLRKYAGAQELVWEPPIVELSSTLLCEVTEHEWAVAGISREHRDYQKGDDAMRWNHDPSAGGVVAKHVPIVLGNACLRCGAWRGAFGLEPTIGMYMQHTVEILREIRRVLRSDGVVFWNIGDSYASTGGHTDTACNERCGAYNLGNRPEHDHRDFRVRQDGRLKPKNLCLIPARVALAAQADGWWVRSLIIWAKPNPMPESCKDRPTDAYEHIIMLTKSARYYWDADAVREPSITNDARKPYAPGQVDARGDGHDRGGGTVTERDPSSRNLRNVWTFPTQPYKGAHFATFPEEIPRRCILAASRVGDLVLDPFAGSGTVGRVAVELNRRAVLIDLAYHDHAERRTRNVQRNLLAVGELAI